MQWISPGTRILALAVAAILTAGSAAFAHHGWAWTDDDFFRLEGRIIDIDIGNPHATLDVEADGETWRVELAPPFRTIAAGFTEEAANVGDEVTAIGNRSRDHAERRMKAVRIIVKGKTYDVYPNRVPPA